MEEQFTINGMISSPKEIDHAGFKVQAFGRDLPSLELRAGLTPRLLGEAITDAQGHFEINYALGNVTNGEVGKPGRIARNIAVDLSFRIFDSAGKELAIQRIEALEREYQENQIIFNAPPHLEVKLYVAAATQAAEQSEFQN